VGSIRLEPIRARSIRSRFQDCAWMCRGGHLPYGSAITFGNCVDSGWTSAEMGGAPKPRATITMRQKQMPLAIHNQRGQNRKETYRRPLKFHQSPPGQLDQPEVSQVMQDPPASPMVHSRLRSLQTMAVMTTHSVLTSSKDQRWREHSSGPAMASRMMWR
jgi:hypothetical protein